MDCASRLARTTFEVYNRDDLERIVLATARQIGVAVSAGFGHHLADLVNFLSCVESTASCIGFYIREITFLMACSEVRHADASKFGDLGGVKFTKGFSAVRSKAIAHVIV